MNKYIIFLFLISGCSCNLLPIRDANSFGIRAMGERDEILSCRKSEHPLRDPNNPYSSICSKMLRWECKLPDSKAIVDIRFVGMDIGIISCEMPLLMPEPRLILWETGELYWVWNNSVFYSNVGKEKVRELKVILSDSYFLRSESVFNNFNGIYDEVSVHYSVKFRIGGEEYYRCEDCDWWRPRLSFFAPLDYADKFNMSKAIDRAWIELVYFFDSIDFKNNKVYLLDVTAVAFEYIFNDKYKIVE